jgi:phage terminase large subunit-like protein
VKQVAKTKSEIQEPSDALRLLGEKLKASAGRPNVLGYKPHIKQLTFHQSDARTRLYIGGNRSGKTTGGVIEDIWWLKGDHPYRPDVNEIARNGGTRGRVIAVDFIQGVDKIILPEFARWIPPSYLTKGSWADSYDQTRRVLTLANGSFVEFMSYDQDLDKFAGTSRHFVHYDEEPPESIYTENLARLIDTGGSSWFTMTPVEGMTWIYDTIYEPGLRGENGIEVIEVDMTENPHLNISEIDFFISGLSEDEKNARLHGKFVQIGGNIYKHFDPKMGGTHVLKTSTVPDKNWLWAVSLDHGFNNPTAILWHAVSPDGRVVTFKEHYADQLTVDQHAKRIHQINNELGRQPDFYIGDPSIRNTDPITGTSIQTEYIKYGIAFMLANNDVKAGINRVSRYLMPDSSGKANWNVTPNCVNLIKEMQRYRWKTYSSKKVQHANNAIDAPHKKDDHACDSLRYFMMSQPDLTSGYSARQDFVNTEYSDLFDNVSRVYEEEMAASPWQKSGDLPGVKYLRAGEGYDDYMGGEW